MRRRRNRTKALMIMTLRNTFVLVVPQVDMFIFQRFAMFIMTTLALVSVVSPKNRLDCFFSRCLQ